jgi:uncharacterized membrane protein SpoIIM required for sporulation
MALALQQFVAERKGGWEQLRSLLARMERGLTPEEVESLDALYRRAASDLAHARVHYPATEALSYLNQLVSRAHAQLRTTRTGRIAALARFYRDGFPRAFHAERRFFRAAWGLLLLGAWLGAVGSYFHPAVAEALVPAELRAHIAARQMWTDSILEAMPPALLSARIFTNNLGVIFIAFAGGLLAGVGTALVLLLNGLELGAVVALCVQRGMSTELFSFIAAHGLVELTAIAIAGQAGLLLGSALTAPGRLSRGEALRQRGKTGVQLVLGAAPMLVGIGLVEGFISPGDHFSGLIRGALGLALGALLYGYLYRFGRDPL